jgi:hypothetical protein
MKAFCTALAGITCIVAVASASAQQFPTIQSQSVIGRLGIPGQSGPSQAIPFATLQAQLAGAVAANTVYAGPATGSTATPAFRALVGADLPAPGASSFGGVQSKTCSTSNWFNTLSTGGVFGCSQPAFSDLTGVATGAQLPNPSASTLGGVQSKAVVTHQFLNTISTSGVPGSAQPACTDLSNATSCNAARGQLPGETSTGSASAGNVGEYIESVIPVGSAVSQTNITAKNVTSISLSAGDWDVYGSVVFVPAGTTSVTSLFMGLSATSATLDLTNGRFAAISTASQVPAGSQTTLAAGPLRFSLSGTTSIFLVSDPSFGVSTMTAYGIIRARRVR